MDYEVIQGLNTQRYKVNVIITEDFVKTKEKKYKLLKSKGYKHINQDGINSIWLLNKIKNF